jgi:hypothetical protein
MFPEKLLGYRDVNVVVTIALPTVMETLEEGVTDETIRSFSVDNVIVLLMILDEFVPLPWAYTI